MEFCTSGPSAFAPGGSDATIRNKEGFGFQRSEQSLGRQDFFAKG
jgi:hypothetical protein